MFAELPDLSVPIDVYFEKQEECQRQAEGSDDLIKDGDMVRMLQKHMGDSRTLTKKRVKSDKRDKAEKTWLHKKEFYRSALEDLEKEAKCAGAREFLTNSIAAVKDRAAIEDQVTKLARSPRSRPSTWS